MFGSYPGALRKVIDFVRSFRKTLTEDILHKNKTKVEFQKESFGK